MAESTPQNRQALLLQVQHELRLMNAVSAFFSQTIADRLQMSSHELESMDLLNLHGPMTPGRLAELTGLTSGGVTRLVDRLERDGFVRRVHDPTDRRRVIIELIPPEVAHRIVPMFNGMARRNHELAQSYSDDELRVIIDFLHKTVVAATAELRKIRGESDESEDGG